MILLDLMCLLILGVFCFWINHIVMVITRKKSQNRRKRNAKAIKTLSKSKIKNDLDDLLSQYNQGMISEQQFYDKANPLIDKLSDLYSDVAWTHQ